MRLAWDSYTTFDFDDLKGKTFIDITRSDSGGSLTFTEDNGTRYLMHHEQSCCESVYLEDIDGDLKDLVGSPLTLSELTTEENDKQHEHETWSFYKLATVKGYVTLRWYGSSNGFYSETVDFVRLK